MSQAVQTYEQLAVEVVDLQARLAEANETLVAIRFGEVDAVLVQGPRGDHLEGLDQPGFLPRFEHGLVQPTGNKRPRNRRDPEKP